MQLSKIKVSGFKSFVDPTILPIPSKLTAIVGPNGCGKSNIIDAVTWVMGESSPKYLRGESLTDVIFNGSSSRKPIGQASVELIFDNSDGTIGGEWGGFADISVKRLINREGDSIYFLNGSKCRKRDVVDLFLGTGLGPRSYSIIGQNMITRLIEAKPDDMRNYLEEAAGISKYKERRHETELRIKHTNENLMRINDVRNELEKQLIHLKQQANTAEKYKTLKQQERELKAECYRLEWYQLDELLKNGGLKIAHSETTLEAKQSEVIKINNKIAEIRETHKLREEKLHETQKEYYAIKNEINHYEQAIHHHQSRKQQCEKDINQIEIDRETLNESFHDAETDLTKTLNDIKKIQPELELLQDDLNELNDAYKDSQHSLNTCEKNLEDFQKQQAAVNQKIEVEKTNSEHLEKQLNALEKRYAQIDIEKKQLNFSTLEESISKIEFEKNKLEDTLNEKKQLLSSIQLKALTLQDMQKKSHQQLSLLRNEWQQLLGHKASLLALQQVALGQNDNQSNLWLKKINLDGAPRLAQLLDVENGWDVAVEKVLGSYLQAICVDTIDELIPSLKTFNEGSLCLFHKNQLEHKTNKKSNSKLVPITDKIKSNLDLDSILAGIYITDTLEDALSAIALLNNTESIVTRDGIWLNKVWLKLLRQSSAADGIFERETKIKSLLLEIKNKEDELKTIENKIEADKNTYQQLENEREEIQQSLTDIQSLLAEHKANLKIYQEKITAETLLSKKYDLEQLDCHQQVSATRLLLENSKNKIVEALSILDNEKGKGDELIKQRDVLRNDVFEYLHEVNKKKDIFHAHEIKLEAAKSQQQALLNNKTQLQNQLKKLNERKEVLENDLLQLPNLNDLHASLTDFVDKYKYAEDAVNCVRMEVETSQEEVKKLEDQRQVLGIEINTIRNELESFRLEAERWKIKADSFIEKLNEMEVDLTLELQNRPEGDVSATYAKLEQITNRINRLGPINLIAIDEYNSCLERKQYLDAQVEDLNNGLSTLEEAISKIDKETRTKFKETFENVNVSFQTLFPKVFGGGKAYLSLTSDNLLEAGVTVMACPPGKRNSSIYLLSGGEKSLTAIALIFSIFSLNPAPFCLLDEVDAALDDANVIRFTNLVKLMAEKTQFIYISHNKLSIEMGEHLIGVTMNEPGVSRLVSVDMEKAMNLVEA